MFGLDPDWTLRVQVIIAIATTSVVLFILMQFWAFYDLEELLIEWVTGLHWGWKIGTTSCLSIGIPLGIYFSFRSVRRAVRNATSFAADKVYYDR